MDVGRKKGFLKLADDVETPESKCLDCGKKFDRASGVGSKYGRNRLVPRPGDITICIGCGHIMAFADDLTMRALTDAEMVEIAGRPDIIAAQKARKFSAEKIKKQQDES